MSASLLAGVVLALPCLAYVLYPLVAPNGRRAAAAAPPEAAGVGIAAREVTDEEIEAAVRSYRATHPGGAAACPVCGPRPERDALYCSSCGRRLATESP